jgi:hypothetical protein
MSTEPNGPSLLPLRVLNVLYNRQSGIQENLEYSLKLMQKTFVFEVDRASWTSVRPALRKTCPFPTGSNRASIDFDGALLWMGRMSVPISLPQWSLASQWAKIRYGTATNPSTDLRLHSAIEDLDTHQKKVLSDDWGVGFSLQFLSSYFAYRKVEHGFAAVQDLRRRKIAKFLPKRKKAGPDKCPDFIAEDRQGRIHVIECKGNQQGQITWKSRRSGDVSKKGMCHFRMSP